MTFQDPNQDLNKTNNTNIIKIDTREKFSPNADRKFKKYDMKINRSDSFKDPIIDLTQEQFEKMDQFLKYCRTINKCIYCQKYINVEHNTFSNENNAIVMQCGSCLNNMIDESQKGKNYVIFINKFLKEYGLSFVDGFPKLMRRTFMGTCTQCITVHEKEMIEYIDLRD